MRNCCDLKFKRQLSKEKKYSINGEEVLLKASEKLFVIRTRKGVRPEGIIKACLNENLDRYYTLVDSFLESNVWVYKIKTINAFSIQEIKKRVRLKNHPDLLFIGSVYLDPDSGRYQLYTGNLFLRFIPSLKNKTCIQEIKRLSLKLKLKLGFAKNAYFVEPVQEVDLQSDAFKDAFEWSAELLLNPLVLSCQPELVVKRKTFPSNKSKQRYVLDPDREWIFNNVNLKEAWNISKGEGIKICIIDDGIDGAHPAFRNNKIVAARDMLNPNSELASHQFENELHGTACASVAASNDDRAFGIAPHAELIIIRCKGLGSVLEAEAIYWAVQQGSDIISCSWGPSDGDIDDPADDLPSHRIPEHTRLALEYAAKKGRNGKGCAIFFAAGNGRESVHLDSYASNPHVMAIGSVNKSNQLSLYSDRGHPLFCVFPSSDLILENGEYRVQYGVTVADRVGIDGYSTEDYFSLFGGTSASAPGVAGVAALMLSINSDLNLNELKDLLKKSCIKIGRSSDYNHYQYSQLYGYGLLDAKYAVENTLKMKKNKNPMIMKLNQKAYALHIGIDKTSPSAYDNFPELLGCVNDSKAMQRITRAENFDEVKMLTNEFATRSNILNQINHFSTQAKEGDLVVITYAGHGSYIQDTNGDEPFDQVLVTYDGFLIDDEIYTSMLKFEQGVRVVWISDCCHSDTNLRMASPIYQGRVRGLNPQKAQAHYEREKSTYDKVRKELSRNGLKETKASVCAMYACQKNEYAQEVSGRGKFTQKIEELYDNDKLITPEEAIQALSFPLLPTQNPKIEFLGGDKSLFEKGLFKLLTTAKNKNIVEMNDNTSEQNPPSISEETIPDPFLSQGKIIIETSKNQIELNSGDRSSSVKRTVRVIEGELTEEPCAGKDSWDRAYNLFEQLETTDDIDFIEPDITSAIFHTKDSQKGRAPGKNEYLPSYPNPEKRGLKNPFTWHLDDKYSQLEKAFKEIKKAIDIASEKDKEELPIICHIDTGVYLDENDYPGVLPENLDLKLSRNFQDVSDSVEDKDKKWYQGVLLENQGHGMGTISILAGGKVPQPNGSSSKNYFGAFPYARVVTLKISETVVLLSGNTFAKALRYAVDIVKCDVVSMSMAGTPSRRMLKAINHAYDKGVVVVSAAGNSWTQGPKTILPKSLMYPARFNRVIAATGVTPDYTPYLIYENRNHNANNRDTGGAYMQTCYGPEDRMRTAIAAYTPNVMWAGKFDHGEMFDRSGGGTSSATPQIAAAAAMWLYYHRKEIQKLTDGKKDWRKAEMARQALFQSAEKSKIRRFNKVFGNGMLKAYDSFKITPQDLFDKIKEEKRDSLGFWISDDIYRLFDPKKGDKNDHELLRKMLNTEIAQLCMIDPAFEHINETSTIEELAEAVSKSENVSKKLRELMLRLVDVPVSKSNRSVDIENLDLNYSKSFPYEEKLDYRIFSENCCFELKEALLHNDNESEITYELKVHPDGKRSDGSPKINIVSSSFKEEDYTLLFIEQDEEDQTQRYEWVIPNTSPKTRSFNGQETFTYEIPSQEANRGRGKIKRFFIKLYRTLADKPLSDMPGLIVGRMVDGKFEWEGKIDSFGEKDKIIAQKRTLFLIHGTLSSATGSFGDLLNTPSFFKELKALGFGDYVLAYNMSTIRSGVKDNAQEVEKKWLPFIKKTKPTVIASSRGCLVARQIFGGSIPMALIAGTHWGTPLASDECLPKYLNRFSTLAAFTLGSGAVLTGILKGIAFTVKIILKAEGLKDQSEDSKFVKSLNKEKPLTNKQLLIGANFEPDPRARRIMNDVIDHGIFNNRDNDGINLTSSALGMDNEDDTPHSNSHRVSGEDTNHFSFFKNPEVLDKILEHFKLTTK